MKHSLKYICFVFGIFSTSQLALAKDFYLDKQIKNGSAAEFLTFNELTQWGSWLQMNLPYAPMRELHKQIEIVEGVRLKTRGEAHITVITPVEFWNVLKSKITMDEINAIAMSLNIQNSKFELICLGKGVANLNNEAAKTYFLVVESKELLTIRQKVHQLFVSRGGRADAFDPRHYFPHITLGFTVRDLHENDGVIKDVNSCVHRLVLK